MNPLNAIRRHPAAVVWSAALGCVALALAMPQSRDLLLRIMAGCPIVAASPEAVEDARVQHGGRLAGTDATDDVSLFGFTLGATRQADVMAWAASSGAECKEKPGFLRCSLSQDPFDNSAQPSTLTFRFEPTAQRLTHIGRRHYAVAFTEAKRIFAARQATFRSRFDSHAQEHGSLFESGEDRPYGNQALRAHFQNVLFDLNAVSIPGRGVVLRERAVLTEHLEPDATSG